MRLRRILAFAVATLPAAPTFADPAPDLARYDCTRTDDGTSASGDLLAAAGFRIVSRARFGNVNVMLADLKSSVRANCFLRPAPR